VVDVNSIPPAPNLLCTDVDYKGVVYGTQLAIHFMRKNPMPGGKIVATASAADLYLMRHTRNTMAPKQQ
jgi:NAD(P)-dependent dehydrogenase (short-subunit alcohol dehydrogenase family)